MHGREAIIRVLQGAPSIRLPRAIFGGGRWAYQQAGLQMEDIALSPDRFADALAGIFGDLDTDIVFAGSGLNTFPAEAIGGELSFHEGQAPLLAHPLIQRDAGFFDRIDINDSPRSLALIAMISRLRRLLPDRFLCATSWGPFAWGMILCDRIFSGKRPSRTGSSSAKYANWGYGCPPPFLVRSSTRAYSAASSFPTARQR